MTSHELLNICHLIWDGTGRISPEEFRDALQRSIGASAEYADRNYIPFVDNPVAYLASRSPQTQSLELVKLIISKTALTTPHS